MWEQKKRINNKTKAYVVCKHANFFFKFSREETEIRDRDRDRCRKNVHNVHEKTHKKEPKKTKQVIDKTSNGMQTLVLYSIIHSLQ